MRCGLMYVVLPAKEELMKSLRGILVATVAMLLMAPALATAQDVHTDYDHKANFESYHTFSFYRVKTVNPLFEQRVRDGVARDLQARGWQMVPSGHAAQTEG